MARTRSARNARQIKEQPEEKYRATEYEWYEEPDENHPAKKLEVRRAIVSPRTKRGRVCTGSEYDDTEDEDHKGIWRKRAKRFKRDSSIEITKVKVKVKDSGAAKVFKSIPIEVRTYLSFQFAITPTSSLNISPNLTLPTTGGTASHQDSNTFL